MEALLAFLGALARASTWRMAGRNALRNPRRTGIVVSAVAVGLGGILVTMAINFGMVFEMVQAAIQTELGDLQVHHKGYDDRPGLEVRIQQSPARAQDWLRGVPGVRAWAPRLRSQGLVFSPRASVGIDLVAVDPSREARVSVLPHSLVEGAWLDGEPRRLVVGERLARRLRVAVGEKVVVSAQDARGEMTGEAFRVVGIFRTSSRELDEGAVFLRMEDGQRLLGVGSSFSELVMVAQPHADLEEIRAALAARLGGDLEVETWKELRPVLVAMIEVFDRMGWIVYVAVFVAMAFGIANVLLMAVYERIREIGILTAIGMPPGRLVASIGVESLCVTMVGVAAGLAIGLGGVWLLRDGIDLSAFGAGLTAYGIPLRIRPVIRASDLWIPLLVSLVTALLASLWPALRAVGIRPAEAFRHG